MAQPVGLDDEVVATVSDEAEARPLVEALLLAGVGPALRPGRAGLEVCVVAGDGPRARRALGRPEAGDPADPRDAEVEHDDGEHDVHDGGGSPRASSTGTLAPTGNGPGSAGPSEAGGTRARRAAVAARSAGLDGRASDVGGLAGRPSVARIAVLCLTALVVIPALAFFLSFKLAGG